jgi:hypothetical protein
MSGCTSNTVDIEDDDGGDPAATTTTGTSGADDAADTVVTTIQPPPPGDASGDPPEPTTVGTTSPPPPPDTGDPGVLPAGRYLLVVSTNVAPDLPFQWIVLVADDGLSFDATSLSLDIGSTSDPRDPVGKAWSSPLDPGCAVCTPLQELTIVGAANPITGSDVVVSFELAGTVWDGFYCGEVYGEILSPISSPLDGSTFALIPLSGDEMLPLDFPFGC